MTNTYLGIDIAKAKFDVALLLDDKFKTKSFSNTASGFELLVAWLKKYEYKELHICMEATGIYGDMITEFLYKNSYNVSVVNPQRIKSFGTSMLSRNKTDEGDAKIIARFCKTMKPDLWAPTPSNIKSLRAWVKRLDGLKAIKYQEANRLESACDEITESINTIISALDKEITKMEKSIKELINTSPELQRNDKLLKSIPGIGDVTSPLLLTFLHDLDSFKNAKQVGAFAGLSPQRRQSGTSVHGKTRLSKVGDSSIRKALYMPSMSALRFNPIIKEFGARLAKNGKCKMQIIGAVMRKLLHIAYGVLRSGKPFDVSIAVAR